MEATVPVDALTLSKYFAISYQAFVTSPSTDSTLALLTLLLA
jgi:hypothetical protein